MSFFTTLPWRPLVGYFNANQNNSLFYGLIFWSFVLFCKNHIAKFVVNIVHVNCTTLAELVIHYAFFYYRNSGLLPHVLSFRAWQQWFPTNIRNLHINLFHSKAVNSQKLYDGFYLKTVWSKTFSTKCSLQRIRWFHCCRSQTKIISSVIVKVDFRYFRAIHHENFLFQNQDRDMNSYQGVMLLSHPKETIPTFNQILIF